MSGIKELDKDRFPQISSDGPNVNLKFIDLVVEKRETEKLTSLLDIGTCALHTVRSCLKTVIKFSNWNVGEAIKAVWKLLSEFRD